MRFIVSVVLLSAILAVGHAQAASADGRAAEILSVQGSADYRIDDKAIWSRAAGQQPLYGGNWVRTGELSRIALMFVDETQVRLSQNSILEVKRVSPPGLAEQSILRILLGRMWARTKAIPANLAISTPSATAGIRGTDWELDVEDNGRSTVAVYSGQVEFYNDQGSVSVGPNEAAVAEVGKAPTKIILTNFKDRVQWVTAYAVDPLRYIVLHSKVDTLKQDAVSPGDSTAQHIARGTALADLNRWTDAEKELTAAYTAGDRSVPTLTGLALAALRNGDRKTATSYLDAAKQQFPQNELVRLTQAAIEINAEDFKSAIATLQTLIQAKDTTQSAAWLILADIKLYFGEATDAENILQDAIKRYPDDPKPYAELGRAYLFADKLTQAREETNQALAKDPNSYLARIARGDLAKLEGDGRDAEKEYQGAISLNPADDRAWFGLGQVNSEREEVKAGKANLNQAISINPGGPGYKGELGSLETFANYLDLAETDFNAALKTNPADYIALTGKGIELLKRGNPEAALEYFNKAGLMEPRYARVHVFSAVAYYQLRRPTRALESLKRASELDPKDPLPYFFASMIHADLIRPADAIDQARQALDRLPYLKSLNQIANDQKGSANLGTALELFGLADWSQSYAQESYYPFWAGSHLFLSDQYPGLYDKNSELLQGFMTDPTVFGASNRFQTLLPAPGNYVSLAAHVNTSHDGTTVEPDLTVNGLNNAAVPVAYYFEAIRTQVDPRNEAFAAVAPSYTAAFGIKPTYELGLFAYINYFSANVELGKATELGTYDGISGNNTRGDFGAHYEFSPQSQLWIKFGVGRENSTDRETITYVPTTPTTTSGSNFVTRPDGVDAQIRHTFAANDQHRITWGYSWGNALSPVDLVSDAYLSVGGGAVPVDTLHESVKDSSNEFYVSDLYSPNERLSIDAGLGWSHYRKNRDTSVLSDHITYSTYETIPETWGGTDIEPRAGVVYRFAPEQLVRIAYQRWTRPATYNTISPIATAGIPLDDQIVFEGGRLSRTRGQVEWAWSRSTFTSAFVDYEQVSNLDSPLDGVQNTRSDLEELDRLRNLTLTTLPSPSLLEGTPIFSSGRIASAGASIDQIISRELSASAGYVCSDGRNTNPMYQNNAIPYIPKQRVNLTATWTNNNRFYVSAQAIYRTQRFADEANTLPLASSWDALLRAYWESDDKRWVVETYAENLLKKDFSNLYGVNLTLRY